MDKAVPAPRFAFIALLTALCTYGPFSVDSYLASMPAITVYFHSNPPMVAWTLSAFLLGQVVAVPLFGPFSDRFGRRPALVWGGLIYMLASALCSFAPSIEWLVAGRFLQALGASCGAVVSRAVVRDIFAPSKAAGVLSYMASATALAPLVAPLIGGWVGDLYGWRANFILMLGFGAVLVALTAAWLTETNRHPNPQAFAPAAMVRTYWHLMCHPSFVSNAAVVGLAFSGVFAYVSSSSFILMGPLGIDARHFGYAFAVTVSGFIAGALTSGRLSARFQAQRMVAMGAWGIAVCGLVAAGFAWGGVQTLSALLLPMSGYFFFTAFIIPNGTALAIIPFPRHAGTASGLMSMFQLGAGALTGVLMSHLLDGTTRPLTSLIAATGVLAVVVSVSRTKVRPASPSDL